MTRYYCLANATLCPAYGTLTFHPLKPLPPSRPPLTLPLDKASHNPPSPSPTPPASPAELVAFAHAALFSPALSTIFTALDMNHVTGFPGLTSKLVRKNPPKFIATTMGHMDQSRNNHRSTKQKEATPTTAKTATDVFPSAPPSSRRTHHVCMRRSPTLTRQTKCFPTRRDGSSFRPAQAHPTLRALRL
jgi:hypothetical protein